MRIVVLILFTLFSFYNHSVSAVAQESVEYEKKAAAKPVQSSTADDRMQVQDNRSAKDQTSEVQGVGAESGAIKITMPDQFKSPVEGHSPATEESGTDLTASNLKTVPDGIEDKAESLVQEKDESLKENRSEVIERKARRTNESDLRSIADYIEQLDRLNRNMADIESEEEIKKILDRENSGLIALMALLKTTEVEKIPSAVNRKEIEFLHSRIAINQERGNELAVQRDQVKLAYYKVIQGINDYIEYLIQVSRNFEGIDDIVGKSVETRTAFEQASRKFALPAEEMTGVVAQDLEKNYQELQIAENTFQDILTFVINNPGLIASTHWFQKFSLISAISFVNSFDFIKPVNYKLSPFRVDAGGIVVSLVIFTLVFLTYPFLFKFSSWFVESYILDKSSESAELIYHELRKPLRFLVIFIGIDMATYSLLYKAKYRFDNMAFIIYALIFVWFLFKVLDSVVISHFEKISKTNKELRRDLVKLGIQIVKGVILIITLAVLLNHFGINITALMSTLGIGGVAFAFAAKDTISNLFGGITILFDNMFKMGDWVRIGDVEGTVAEIGLRSTTVRTFDNALVTVPNSQISVSSVVNWNRRAVGRRIKMYVGVTYESNMDDIRNALEDIRTMLKQHPGISNPKQKLTDRKRPFKLASHEDTQGIKSTQLVYMDRYNDYSIDILIYCFSRTVNWAEWLEVKEDVLFKIAEILKKNHLDFAYPTQVRIHRRDDIESDRMEDHEGLLDVGARS